MSGLEGKKVLVTGSCGFIGSHLVERLVEEGARVRALVYYNSFDHWGWLDSLPEEKIRRVEVLTGDIRDFQGVRQAVAGREIVFHLAALVGIPYSYVAPASYVETNVKGTLHVLQAAREAGAARVVHTSTSEVYGTARYVPMDEEHPLTGQSPYSATKIAADKLAEAHYLSYGLPVIVIRPFNTFGPRQSARAVIPTIISQALAGSAVRLGLLSPTRDFNYVADVVEAFLRAAQSPAAVGQVINVGTGKEVSIGELARTILNLLGRKLPIVNDSARIRPENSEVERLCADNTRARDLLGWRPRHTLERGLSETISWMEGNLEGYRPGLYAV